VLPTPVERAPRSNGQEDPSSALVVGQRIAERSLGMAGTHCVFEGGFPTPETVQRAHDDADLNRAVQAYRFFFPTVSGLAIFKGTEAVGVTANQVFGVLTPSRSRWADTQLRHPLRADLPGSPRRADGD
jgi:hypothetical protein